MAELLSGSTVGGFLIALQNNDNNFQDITAGDITAIKFIGSGESLTNIPWSSLTGKPTTLSGYGITDAVNTVDVVTTATANKILKLNSNQKLPQSITGNQETTTKLQTQRTIQLAGQVTGSQSFDGSQNISITTTLTSHTHTSQQISNQTNANTANMIVKRDQSGNFSAGTITQQLSGNQSTATKLQTQRSIQLTGQVAGSQNFDGSQNVSIATTLASHTHTSQQISDQTNANTASTIVIRDQSGNFSQGTITASLSGNQSTQSKWQTQRTLTIGSTGKSVDGSGNVSWSIQEIGAAPQAGSTSITTVGTITTGSWDAGSVISTGVIRGSISNGAQAFYTSGYSTSSGYANYVGNWQSSGTWGIGPSTGTTNNTVRIGNVSSNGVWAGTQNLNLVIGGNITGAKVYGAVYNDYQEYRNSMSRIEAGYVCIESENGNIELCKKDRQKNIQGIQSDTYGTIMGDSNQNNTPVSVQGRVLVYADNKRKLKIGDQVCATKNGKIRKMKWYEKILFPEQIVGIVSEFPTYETWGTDNIAVNNRIWLNIRR